MVCYFAASHPHTQEELQHFSEDGDMCPEWDRNVIDPIIAALPLVFRALQCLRRFHDTPTANKHILNFGKYFTSIIVVVASAINSKSTVTIVFSVAATIYSATWDIKMDWGLSWAQLMRLRTQGRVHEHEQAPFSQRDRCFSPCVYVCASVADVVARLVWVLSLLPLSALTEEAWNRAIVRAVMSALELLRRSVWAVLRIEYEQTANGGGFRSILWVPPPKKSSRVHTSPLRKEEVAMV